ncbi:MAG TPA: DMT family transporter [Spirochaetales bacterium]|mgnify:FL=1|nr:DMT family transporter [Spirochaetales bacterium]HPB66934.1 DMT family transporter [Spirochaetales bacterium]HPG85092.1 DMT family transporter [Spirochaetales bacterium]HPM73791.1 DMT family transporter [Spirochaetales bacterium]
MQRIGELAAFGTAICWTVSSMFFERATKRVGVLAVNFYKLVFAFGFLVVAGAASRGMPLPLDATRDAWIFLSLSGLVGFVISDIFLFTAYKTIGSRITLLFVALSPPMTAALGFLFLGETMRPLAIVGMGLVVVGIVIAVLGRRDQAARTVMSRDDKRGYVFALFSAIGQSVGMILTKRGIGDYDALSATQIRVLVGVVGFAVASVLAERGRNLKAAVRDAPGMKSTFSGAIFGPFLGVVLSLYAVQQTNAGVVSTLMALSPVLIIPPAILVLKQKVRFPEIAGAVIAVAGSAIFFL